MMQLSPPGSQGLYLPSLKQANLERHGGVKDQGAFPAKQPHRVEGSLIQQFRDLYPLLPNKTKQKQFNAKLNTIILLFSKTDCFHLKLGHENITVPQVDQLFLCTQVTSFCLPLYLLLEIFCFSLKGKLSRFDHD